MALMPRRKKPFLSFYYDVFIDRIEELAMDIKPCKISAYRMKHYLGTCGVLGALALIIYLLAFIGMAYKSPSAKVVERIWQEDIDNLSIKHKLPPFWGEIRTVEKDPAAGDAEAAHWVKDTVAPIEINPKGDYKLEVLFLSQKEGVRERAVIQHKMIHIPSGNLVWELDRTYQLN
jgi:hypothetical protein